MSEAATRERVITMIPQRIQPLTQLPLNASRKRKVAGYARVSTDSDKIYAATIDRGIHLGLTIPDRPDAEGHDERNLLWLP